jgi:hypothetical protein
MTIGLKVYTALANDAQVVSVVTTRIYPMVLPQTPTLPAITYQRISNPPRLGNTELREARFQINVWGESYADVIELANYVKTVFEDYTDTEVAPRIKYGKVINEIDDYDDETETYRVIIDVILTTTGD